jgi:X-X-X-Leu-X-X-Gly heptad repeat protein
MATNERQEKVVLSAEDKTQAAFKQLATNMNTLNSSASSLSSGLTKLGLAGAALYAGNQLVNFLVTSTQRAMEDEDAMIRLNAAMSKLGQSGSSAQLDDFINSMVKLGQDSSTTASGLQKLMNASGTANESMYLSKLATDLAASGLGDYDSNVSALSNLLLGRSRQAAAAFGIDMKDNSTTLETLNAIQEKVTISMEDFINKSSSAKLKSAQSQWEEFTSTIGKGLLALGNWFAEPFNSVFEQLSDSSSKAAYNEALAAEKARQAEIAGKKELETQLAKQQADEDAQTLNDKLKSSFRDLAKTIVSSMNDEMDAIDNLKKEIIDVDSALEESIAKTNESYNNSVIAMAKSAQTRIDSINKQIEQEKSAMSDGWRDKIKDLEDEKAKEQAIIDKANGVVSNLSEETAKDDFDTLTEQHNKELAEITSDAEKKKSAYQKEIDDRTKILSDNEKKITSPGFYEEATSAANTFLGSIGANQVINFNFNDAVAGDEGIKKIISDTIDELNRQAQLKGIGGK